MRSTRPTSTSRCRRCDWPGLQPFRGLEGHGDQRARAWTWRPRPASRRSAPRRGAPARSARGAAAGRPSHAGWLSGCSALLMRAASSRAPAASHISRGSKASAASMVRITTLAKATAPKPELMLTSAAELHQRDQDRGHEDVDHRPAADRRDDAVEPGCGRAAAAAEPSRVATSMAPSAISLSTGTTMLAKNTRAASGYMPLDEQLHHAAHDGAGRAGSRAGSRSGRDRRSPAHRG